MVFRSIDQTSEFVTPDAVLRLAQQHTMELTAQVMALTARARHARDAQHSVRPRDSLPMKLMSNFIWSNLFRPLSSREAEMMADMSMGSVKLTYCAASFHFIASCELYHYSWTVTRRERAA